MASLPKEPIEMDEVRIPPADSAHLVPTPEHVPADKVYPFPYVLGATTKLPPHRFIPEIHENAPEVFWAERVYNGIRGAWVPRKLEHLHQVYNDNEHFCARDFRSDEHTSELQSLMRNSYAVFCLQKKTI